MTLPESETTPLALTAALFHEAGRLSDYITCGMPKAPWDDQPEDARKRTTEYVARARNQTFEEFYEVYTSPFRLMNKPVPEPTDASDALVRHARMLHSIVHGLLQTETAEVRRS
ncbi:hypothetical protein [Streptomyces lydicus]|uniref:hypothetical protein n=1 Tax=Streptomyces lydicus TaxID=47763 RepID=UPI0037F81367